MGATYLLYAFATTPPPPRLGVKPNNCLLQPKQRLFHGAKANLFMRFSQMTAVFFYPEIEDLTVDSGKSTQNQPHHEEEKHDKN